jgi:hypothetical protein
VRTAVLASVELDDHALRAPQAVDRPRPDLLVALGELDPVADEQLAEAALETALHLAVAGSVLAQGGAEVGAARVALAQGALDVGGAQVVVELGFGEGAQQRAAVVAGREVQEGARDGGGGEAAVVGRVARAQVAADEDRDPLHLRMTSRHCEFDHRGRGGDDAPAPGRRPATEQRAVAHGQQGGQEMPFLDEQFRRHRRIDPAVHGVQCARTQGAVDCRPADASAE